MAFRERCRLIKEFIDQNPLAVLAKRRIDINTERIVARAHFPIGIIAFCTNIPGTLDLDRLPVRSGDTYLGCGVARDLDLPVDMHGGLDPTASEQTVRGTVSSTHTIHLLNGKVGF